MKLSKDEKVVLYTMLKFKDIPIGMLGLNKLLYDCELNSVDLNGKTLTNLDFIHYNLGPMVKELYDIVRKFADFDKKNYVYGEEIKEEEDTSNFTVKKEYLNNDIDFDFSEEDKKILDNVLDEWLDRCTQGRIPMSSLINVAYMTEPLLETPFNEKIDLMKYGKNSQISEVLIHHKEMKQIIKNAKKYQDELLDFIDG
ncbi:Panacea domain-containing protein [Brachyspira murdochii]|uniref:Antitoxin SocA-like Panacea domain-containing protein n=1 Tax=Brachyspira murdochii TaxID=84378 RepID=A0ABX5B8E6_9SPIR|nr:Panacea domain-containing protein [Brachyspira murdochii]PPS22941.1 hypothetical protein DJ52_01730 [Brachyspira murdochii]